MPTMADTPPGRSGSRWPYLLQIAIQTIAWLLLVWAGFRIIGMGSTWLGIVTLALGGLTAFLSIRRLRRSLRSPDDRVTESGDLPRSELDYIIWTAVGLPVILGIVLLVFVVTGRR
jgi:hypothetical protein